MDSLTPLFYDVIYGCCCFNCCCCTPYISNKHNKITTDEFSIKEENNIKLDNNKEIKQDDDNSFNFDSNTSRSLSSEEKK